MKTFIVQTNANTLIEVDVDDSLYDKYKDMAVEAMAIAFEKFFSGDFVRTSDAGLAYIVIAYEKDSKDDPNKHIVCLTTHVLRNIGYHDLADECHRQINKIKQQ
tara:strand:+ start:217 stop:528 length:312 start_codon:yes stop_codon:yes gene_type:complete